MFGFNGIGLGCFVSLISVKSGIQLVGEGDCIGLLVETKVPNSLLGLGLIDFLLGDGEVVLEVLPVLFHSGPGIPFPDITTKDVGVFDDDQADIDELDVSSGVFGCFRHGGVIVDIVEDGGDGIGMGVGDLFDVTFFF